MVSFLFKRTHKISSPSSRGMAGANRMIYKDNIWGDIEFSGLAEKLIDTKEFERLDGLKQLNLADLVYRGAKHTRFQHSIGVYHLAKKICNNIPKNHKRLDLEPFNSKISDIFLDEYLFTIEENIGDLVESLNETETTTLKEKYERNGLTLSENFTVEVVEENRLWRLNDKNKGYHHNIRKEDGKLNVYLNGSSKYYSNPDTRDSYKEFSNKMKSIKKIVSIAALLHDITHIPFGHTLEDEFDEFQGHDEIKSPRLWYLLFDENSEIRKILVNPKDDWLPEENDGRWISPISNKDLRDLLFLILKFKHEIKHTGKIESFEDKLENIRSEVKNGESQPRVEEIFEKLSKSLEKFSERDIFHPFMADIVGNTICADMLDYIRRDLRNCGIKSKGYDERIFRYFIIGEDNSMVEYDTTSPLRLGLSIYGKRGAEKGDIITEILNIMDTRHTLAERVYYHKTKAAASTMLLKLLRGRKPKDSNPYEGEEKSILNLTDSELIHYIKSRADNELLTRFKERKLNKVGAIIPFTLFNDLASNLNDFIDTYHATPEELEKIESECKVERDTFVYCPERHPQAKEIGTFIQEKHDEVRLEPLTNRSEGLDIQKEIELLSEERYERLWNFFLFIHPDDAKNEIIVSKIVTNFLEYLAEELNQPKEDLIENEKVVTHMDYKPTEKLKENYLEEWRKNKSRKVEEYLLTEEIFKKIEEEIHKYSREELPSSKEDFFELFDDIWTTEISHYSEPDKRGANTAAVEKFREDVNPDIIIKACKETVDVIGERGESEKKVEIMDKIQERIVEKIEEEYS